MDGGSPHPPARLNCGYAASRCNCAGQRRGSTTRLSSRGSVRHMFAGVSSIVPRVGAVMRMSLRCNGVRSVQRDGFRHAANVSAMRRCRLALRCLPFDVVARRAAASARRWAMMLGLRLLRRLLAFGAEAAGCEITCCSSYSMPSRTQVTPPTRSPASPAARNLPNVAPHPGQFIRSHRVRKARKTRSSCTNQEAAAPTLRRRRR
jgi:hypothetical protein